MRGGGGEEEREENVAITRKRYTRTLSPSSFSPTSHSLTLESAATHPVCVLGEGKLCGEAVRKGEGERVGEGDGIIALLAERS